jgi:hypothetical protein
MKQLRPCCIALTLSTGGLWGCATTHLPPAPEVSATIGTESCFWVRNVRSWDVLDPSTLIVYAPLPQNAYLVKLLQPIPDLNFRFGLAFEDHDRTGRICRADDDVSVGEPFPMRVPIAAVRALTSEQVRQLKSSAKGIGVSPPGSVPSMTPPARSTGG